MNKGMSPLDDRSRVDPAPSWLAFFVQPQAALDQFRGRRTHDVGPPLSISLIRVWGLTQNITNGNSVPTHGNSVTNREGEGSWVSSNASGSLHNPLMVTSMCHPSPPCRYLRGPIA